MTEMILGIDPGDVTGWSLWMLDRDAPIQRVDYGMIHGGLPGFVSFMEVRLGGMRPDVTVCEKFNDKDGRSAMADFTPMLIEGSVYTMASALGLELIFQPTAMKAMCSDEKLKELGFYITNAEARENPAIRWSDARDVNDSEIHVLAWAKSIDHTPTVEAFWPDV